MSDANELVGPDDALEPTDVIPVITCSDGGVLVRIHQPSACAGRPCCIHDPSDHPLRDAPLHWRSDLRLMERVCAHRVGHPDPDDRTVRTVDGADVHGCDGCCRRPRHDVGVIEAPRASR